MHRTKTNHPVNHIDRLRQQFALLGQDTFCKALGSDQVEQILREEVGPYRERIYPPMVTLRLFIDQILSPDAACQDAVGRRLSQRAADNQSPCSLNNGPYCKARRRMALRLPQRLCKHLGQSLEGQAARLWGWRGRSIKIFDATTVSMPDTPPNQQAWPQSRTQGKGLGFPVVRIGALISLASGCVMDYALGPLSGKGILNSTVSRKPGGDIPATPPDNPVSQLVDALRQLDAKALERAEKLLADLVHDLDGPWAGWLIALLAQPDTPDAEPAQEATAAPPKKGWYDKVNKPARALRRKHKE